MASRKAAGIPNCLFLNAQNKQTIHKVLGPLRQMGIPVAAIPDVDVIKEGGANWSNLLSSANVPQISENSLANLRAGIKAAMDSTGRDMKRDGGIAILQKAQLEAAENLLSQLAEYGVFIVPGGEVESWLKQLGATGHGSSWLVSIFGKMGDDPGSPDYEKPGEGDVWSFISKIRSWLLNPNRKGIPE